MTRSTKIRNAVLAMLLGSLGALRPAAQTAADWTTGRPDATVNLATLEGARLMQGQWRYSDARIREIDFRGPGPDLKPSGAAIKTYDIFPKAGVTGFDDSQWEIIPADSLERHRATGRLSFNWYRIRLTVPERIGNLDPAGATAVFEIVVDDYAEVWVDGKLPRVLGQSGGQLVGGFNARNRLVVGRNLRPGDQIQLAVFGMNGPLSDPPENFIWIRSATLDFYKSAPARERVETRVAHRQPGLEAVLGSAPQVEKLASGFLFTEGPVWHPDGYLLFSDPNANNIYRWTPDGPLSVFRSKSGYAAPDIGEYNQPGSNGLTLDAEGRLTICEHGNRRVVRVERNGVVTVLADRFEGRRLNSPNDLVYRSDGALYFTDPPFGLPRFDADPRKELPFSGVFLLRNGKLQLVSKDLAGPNGLAFSPDERYLYVTNWDPNRKVVMRYAVAADGGLSDGKVFFDMTGAPGEEALDGVKVDREGHLYVSGPGGLWILSPEGKHLGTLQAPELPANFAWGDSDGRTLYLTARTGLYRIRLDIPGARAASETDTSRGARR